MQQRLMWQLHIGQTVTGTTWRRGATLPLVQDVAGHTALILLINGADRPNIVARLSDIVAAHDGNWEDARLARLSGRFAGVIRVSVPTAQEAQLRATLTDLSTQGLSVIVESAEGEAPAGDNTELDLELVGGDRPGLLRDITRILGEHTVNVEELTTRRREAPMGGGMLFEATARIAIVKGATSEPLRTALEALSAELAVEIVLHED